uniref:Uncharacterized protein n=1 Tax=Eutreptiella gymnastica TaxID=73025 RepID=A0A7S1II16_9EUGL
MVQVHSLKNHLRPIRDPVFGGTCKEQSLAKRASSRHMQCSAGYLGYPKGSKLKNALHRDEVHSELQFAQSGAGYEPFFRFQTMKSKLRTKRGRIGPTETKL